MNSATLLTAVSLFLFILKHLMIWSKTNYSSNPIWIGISFLNSWFLYLWFLWGGFKLSEFLREKELERIFDLKKAHELELQKERSKRHECERKLEGLTLDLRRQQSDHQSEIQALRSSKARAVRTASDANDQALRSLL